MLNFYPGPSKLDSNIKEYYQQAVDSGILEMNHRSTEFELLYRSVKELFQTKLSMPKDYELLFVSSATEAWEVISQSFLTTSSSHYYNGSFGEKWFQYTNKIKPNTLGIQFEVSEMPSFTKGLKVPELIALTHNETANGTSLPLEVMHSCREMYPDTLIAYDATSSMAGIDLMWSLGDIWFASVQKCFGLPAGLGVVVVSPSAVEKAMHVQDNTYYNSFSFILKNARKWQTHYTPNVANIFLLHKVLGQRSNIDDVSKKLGDRAEQIYGHMHNLQNLNCHVDNDKVRSPTVVCMQAEESYILSLKKQAIDHGILLGNGYGALKESTIRIANFPAIPDEAFDQLLTFLSDFDKRY